MTSRAGDTTELDHGSFDNDIEVVEKTLQRILSPGDINFPVEALMWD